MKSKKISGCRGHGSFKELNTIYLLHCLQFLIAIVIFEIIKKIIIKKLEAPGIDPGTSHMLSERSTI